MASYVKTAVMQKDVQEMLELSKIEFVKDRLKEQRAYSHEYSIFRNGR